MKISESLAKLFPSDPHEPVSTVNCAVVNEAIDIVLLKNSHFLCSNSDIIRPEKIIDVRQTIVNKSSRLKTRPKMWDIDPMSP